MLGLPPGLGSGLGGSSVRWGACSAGRKGTDQGWWGSPGETEAVPPTRWSLQGGGCRGVAWALRGGLASPTQAPPAFSGDPGRERREGSPSQPHWHTAAWAEDQPMVPGPRWCCGHGWGQRRAGSTGAASVRGLLTGEAWPGRAPPGPPGEQRRGAQAGEGVDPRSQQPLLSFPASCVSLWTEPLTLEQPCFIFCFISCPWAYCSTPGSGCSLRDISSPSGPAAGGRK